MRTGKAPVIIFALCVVFYFWACIWSTSAARIDGIIHSGCYHLSIKSCGCFGCDSTILTVIKNGDKMEASRTQTVYDVRNKSYIQVVPVRWDKVKDEQLQNIIHSAS